MMRQRLLRLSGLLATVLLLQWAIGVAGCIASMVVPNGPQQLARHAGDEAVPRTPDVPAGHDPAASLCPICVQFSATVLPGPPASPCGPSLIHVAAPVAHGLPGSAPIWSSPAHLATGPPGFS